MLQRNQRDETWSEMIKVKRKEKADRLSAEAREKELTRQFLETASLENDIDNITTCIAMFNPYSGRMTESMNISIDLEDLQDHLELKEYVMDLDISLETLIFDSQMEITAHDELDSILRGVLDDEDVKMTELVEEGVNMDISLEDWEKDIANIDFDEWLVSEMTEMYEPQSVPYTSSTSPPVTEGRGKNTSKDIYNIVHKEAKTVQNMVHTVQKTSLPNVRKVQEEGGN